MDDLINRGTTNEAGDNSAIENSMSNESVDVVKRMLELSETVTEAIEHFIARISVDDIGQGSAMLAVIGDGMESIENTFSVVLSDSFLDAEAIEKCDRCFAEAAGILEMTINAAIDGNLDELANLSVRLKAAYKTWDDTANFHLRKITLM